MTEYRPLADKIRPESLDDVVGQTHILGKGGILRRIVESGQIPNMIFYGPSGTGKTTVANIIAKATNRKLYKLNATTASVNDIKAMSDAAAFAPYLCRAALRLSEKRGASAARCFPNSARRNAILQNVREWLVRCSA